MRIFRNGYDILTVGLNLVEIDTVEKLSKIAFSKPTVFTTGCFDLYHAGHVHFLYEAHRFGSRLIVGLDTDESIKKLKGNERPVYPFGERLAILLANKYVDYVVEGCTEEWPEIMKALAVDVFVKGAEYKDKHIELSQYAQRTEYVEMFGDRHSSQIIENLRISNGHYGPRPKKVSKNAD